MQHNPVGEKQIDDGGDGDHRDAFARLQEVINTPDIIDKAFKTQDVISAVQMLVDPGHDVSQLTMRGDFPEARFLKAAARHLAKCRKFHYVEGEAELLFVVSGYPGIKGKRAAMLVESIIGERKAQQSSQEGFGDKVRRALHI